MTSKKTLAGSLLSLSTGLLLAVSAIGGASASSATSLDSTQLQVTSTPVSSPQGYWTPERMQSAEGRLTVVCTNSDLLRIFRQIGLDQTLQIVDSRPPAAT